LRARFRAGFTLVELLVVIAIISVMAGILFPVYASAKKSAYRATCQANLCQIGRAFEAYTGDYNGCYPCTMNDPNTGKFDGQYLWQGRYWRWALKRYVGFAAGYDNSDPMGALQNTHVWKSILRCPADPMPGSKYDGTSYGYSAAFYHTPEQVNLMTKTQLYSDPSPSFAVVKNSSVVSATKKALAADWVSHTDDKATWWKWAGSRDYLFADGHVVYLSASKIHSAVDSLPDINLTKDGVAGKDID
jgi:prepilin-type N-terminal cleavage/methylation domain-containing protein/prepilin-type processing-associated H-X9-DG protein